MNRLDHLPNTFAFQIRIMGLHLSKVMNGSWAPDKELDAIIASLEILTEQVEKAKTRRHPHARRD